VKNFNFFNNTDNDFRCDKKNFVIKCPIVDSLVVCMYKIDTLHRKSCMISHFCITFLQKTYHECIVLNKFTLEGACMRSKTMKTVVAVALCLTAFSYANADAGTEEDKNPFGVVPQEMIGITMKDGDALHDKHVAKLEELGKDCTVCHIDDNYEAFMAVDKEKGQDGKVAYLHKNCVRCHIELGDGPNITSCRSCHNEKFAAE